jgi:tryptophanyl-tRNA synthetase
MANEIATEIKHVDMNNSNIKCEDESEEDVVNPWNVVSKSETGIDYDKLISKYISRVCTNRK